MREPVILLPGAFGQDLIYWNVWQYFLERDGFRVYPFSFPRLTLSDLRQSARLLRDKVEEVRQVEDVENVSLVAHSMGGLIARYYLKYLRGSERISRLCCLGVPHHGTWTAATAPLLKGTRQILPGSPFLQQLNDPAIDHGGVPILNVWSGWDGIVIPSSSAVLLQPQVQNVELRYANHWRMLVSRKAYRWIMEELASPQPGRTVRRIANEARMNPLTDAQP